MTSNLASTEIAEHGLQLRRESEDIAHKKAMDAASNDETNKSDDSDDNSNNEEKTSVKVLLFFFIAFFQEFVSYIYSKISFYH